MSGTPLTTGRLSGGARSDRRHPLDLSISPSTGVEDTAPEVRALQMEAYRRMTGVEKLERVMDLNRAVESLALARIRKRYGADLSEREERFRLASLYLPRETMVEAFGWDPDVRGR